MNHGNIMQAINSLSAEENYCSSSSSSSSSLPSSSLSFQSSLLSHNPKSVGSQVSNESKSTNNHGLAVTTLNSPTRNPEIDQVTETMGILDHMFNHTNKTDVFGNILQNIKDSNVTPLLHSDQKNLDDNPNSCPLKTLSSSLQYISLSTDKDIKPRMAFNKYDRELDSLMDELSVQRAINESRVDEINKCQEEIRKWKEENQIKANYIRVLEEKIRQNQCSKCFTSISETIFD